MTRSPTRRLVALVAAAVAIAVGPAPVGAMVRWPAALPAAVIAPTALRPGSVNRTLAANRRKIATTQSLLAILDAHTPLDLAATRFRSRFSADF